MKKRRDVVAVVVLMIVEEYGKKKEGNGREKIEKFTKHEFKSYTI